MHNYLTQNQSHSLIPYGETISEYFRVKIDKQETFADLKKLITTENPNAFKGIDHREIMLYRTDTLIMLDNDRPYEPVLSPGNKLVVGEISTQFPVSPSLLT